MSTVLHVVAARPNFVKVAPVVRALARRRGLRQLLVHTGQHYDRALSEEILADVGLGEPDRRLGIGSGSHGEQIGRTLMAFERLLAAERPDLVVVAGDVNATLACALACAREGIPVAHVESGLRSGEWTMPEEQNRVLTDRLCDVLFTHSPEARDNLLAEGLDPARIHEVGNTMIDTLCRLKPLARRRAFWERLGLGERSYALVTLHRPSNVDHAGRLAAIVERLGGLAARAEVVFPVHPRTRARLEAARLDSVLAAAGVHVTEPLGYVDFLSLETAAGAIVTDSGGVQEEAAALGVPCYTLRASTERPVTLTHGTNVLLGEDPAALARVRLSPHPPTPCAIPLWDGRAGKRAAAVIAAVLATGASSAARRLSA